jgi:hypothetical protein
MQAAAARPFPPIEPSVPDAGGQRTRTLERTACADEADRESPVLSHRLVLYAECDSSLWTGLANLSTTCKADYGSSAAATGRTGTGADEDRSGSSRYAATGRPRPVLRFHFATERLPAGEPVRAVLRDALDRADLVISEEREKVRELRAEAVSAGELEKRLSRTVEAMKADGGLG